MNSSNIFICDTYGPNTINHIKSRYGLVNNRIYWWMDGYVDSKSFYSYKKLR